MRRSGCPPTFGRRPLAASCWSQIEGYGPPPIGRRMPAAYGCTSRANHKPPTTLGRLLAIGRLLLTASCGPPTADCLLLTAHHCPPSTARRRWAARYWPPIVGRLVPYEWPSTSARLRPAACCWPRSHQTPRRAGLCREGWCCSRPVVASAGRCMLRMQARWGQRPCGSTCLCDPSSEQR